MALWPEVEATTTEPTAVQGEQLRQAGIQFGDYNEIFLPVEQNYLNNVMDQDYSGYAKTRAAAESAQVVGDSREKMGPVNVTSGLGQKNLQALGGAQGTAAAGSIAAAGDQGEVNKLDRRLNALQRGLGIQSDISQTTATAAQSSASRARTLAESELQMNMDTAAGQTQFVSDIFGGLGKGAQKYGWFKGTDPNAGNYQLPAPSGLGGP